ncbi:MAG: hypothetical protein FJ090_02890 [Deltaproteobacteria bacterium]|nr:hypothetical protein [Deltaproteobacteria bacterium]
MPTSATSASVVALLAAGCSPGGTTRAGDPGASPVSADSGDTARPADTGLDWSGDVASYGGCVAGDPEAKLLSASPPVGPVTAGATVSGEIVFAHCGASAWVVADAEDSVSGVKLGAVSDTVMHTWDHSRVLLPRDIAPGEAVRLAWTGTAPLVNGDHPWAWQMLEEWVRWIEDPAPVASVLIEGGYGPFTVHTRYEWQTADHPVDGSSLDLRDLEYITIHYNGVTEDLDGDDDVYTDADTIESLQDSQRQYIEGRGYSYGYNSEIAPDGDEWEIRGYDFESAANGCSEVNDPSYTIQVPTTSPEAAPTGAQVEGTRAAILRVRQAAAAAGNPNFLYINGHRDVRPLCDGLSGTSCPGEPLYAMILDGSLEP